MPFPLRPAVAIMLFFTGILLLAGTWVLPVSVFVVTVVSLVLGLAILLDALPVPDSVGAVLTAFGLLALLSPTMAGWIGDWSPFVAQAGGGVVLLTAAAIAWGAAPQAKR